MRLTEIILSIAGKGNTQLDCRISNRYIFRLCWKYGLMLLRGFFFSFGYKNISNKLFIGNKVRVLEKKNLSVGKKTRIQDNVYIDAWSTNGIVLGESVLIGRNSRLECTRSIECIGKGMNIGNQTTFGNDCYFGAADGITIGVDVVAGQFIRLHSENHNFSDMTKLIREQGVTHKGIKIGNNCWIGAV